MITLAECLEENLKELKLTVKFGDRSKMVCELLAVRELDVLVHVGVVRALLLAQQTLVTVLQPNL